MEGQVATKLSRKVQIEWVSLCINETILLF